LTYTIERTFTHNGVSSWKWPAVPGIEKFSSKLHTAAWDHTIDLTDKIVGVIGNGSSAVQVIPAIFPSMYLAPLFVARECILQFFQQKLRASSASFAQLHGLQLALLKSMLENMVKISTVRTPVTMDYGIGFMLLNFDQIATSRRRRS